MSQPFPGSVHVRDVELARADDEAVWEYAKGNVLTIVSKDADFHQRSFVLGHPPKVMWIRRGNCSTGDIESLLRSRTREIRDFARDDQTSFLALG